MCGDNEIKVRVRVGGRGGDEMLFVSWRGVACGDGIKTKQGATQLIPLVLVCVT